MLCISRARPVVPRHPWWHFPEVVCSATPPEEASAHRGLSLCIFGIRRNDGSSSDEARQLLPQTQPLFAVHTVATVLMGIGGTGSKQQMATVELAVAANSYQWQANSHEIKTHWTQVLAKVASHFMETRSCFSTCRKSCEKTVKVKDNSGQVLGCERKVSWWSMKSQHSISLVQNKCQNFQIPDVLNTCSVM